MISEKKRELCHPGKFCLRCPYPDCISGSKTRTREETALLKLADLPDGREGKKYKQRKEGNNGEQNLERF